MFNILTIIQSAGYFGLFGIIFAESGLVMGAFFPGDSLLFAAGILASRGLLNFPITVAIISIAAILGNSAGYFTGQIAGPRIFKREDSFFFHKDYLDRTKKFYDEHGARTIVLARFVPIVRTFIPILAGVGRMPYKTFLTYNIIGAGLWGLGITGLGYALGNTIPNIDRYLLPIVILIIIISLAPTAREYYKGKDKIPN